MINLNLVLLYHGGRGTGFLPLIFIILVIGGIAVLIRIIQGIVKGVIYISEIPKRVKAHFQKKEEVKLPFHPFNMAQEKALSPILINKGESSLSSSIPYEALRAEWIKNQTKELDDTPSITDFAEREPLHNIDYSHLLLCVEWRTIRVRVLIRDKFKCQDCGLRHKSNHVHHTYYLKDTLPWVIDPMALVTVCGNCHYERHRKENIGVYEFKLGKRIRTSYASLYCGRCNGSGFLPQFSHVENGRCFACNGSCVNKTIFSKALEAVKRNLTSQNREVVRKEYREYLQSITTHVYENNIHFIDDYIPKASNKGTGRLDNDMPFHPGNNSYKSNIDDDLPF